jgi:hypothetical protein
MNAFLVAFALTVPLGQLTAPVYQYVSDGLMARVGTFTYKPTEGYSVLYCVAQPPRITLQCVVQTPQHMLVLIQAQATETPT